MKKIVIILLFFLGTLLVGCKSNNVPNGSTNTSFDQEKISSIYTQELIDKFQPERTFNYITVDVDSMILRSNPRVIQFQNNRLYSIASDKFFPINVAEIANIDFSKSYVQVEMLDSTYKIYNMMTTELLYTFNFDSVNETTYYSYDFIENVKTDEAGEKTTVTHYFVNFLPGEKPIFNDNPILSNMYDMTVDNYGYRNSEIGIMMYKDDKYYASYLYNIEPDDIFLLENGNIIIQYLNEMPSDSTDYDVIIMDKRYKLTHHLYEIDKKQYRELDLGYLIDEISRKTEEFSFGVDNVITFRTIDPISKQRFEMMRIGSFSNDLKLKEVSFEFGGFGDLFPFNTNSYLVENDNRALFLVDGSNKVINSISFDIYNYRSSIYKNETIFLRDVNFGDVYIYNLRDSALLYSGYKFVDIVEKYNFVIKDDKYYVFDGELKEIDAENLFFMEAPVYIALKDGTYTFYYLDGTTLFEASDSDYNVRYHYDSLNQEEVYIFTYKALGITTHTILRVSGGMMR